MKLVLWAAIAVLGTMLLSQAAWADPPTGDFKIFDGSEKIIIVNGYSTSRDWPDLLQMKIDDYIGSPGVIEVRKAIRGGTPIAKWIDVATGAPLEPWLSTARPALQTAEATGKPVIFLGQQSLQWVYGTNATTGIRGPSDVERIAQGADAMAKYVNLAFDDGADHVFLATHIYKGGINAYEPTIENEKYALDALMTQGIIDFHSGPDVWTPTMLAYPEAFAGDRVHPNALGAEIMAQHWFETLQSHDVPEPASLTLLLCGGAVATVTSHRKRKRIVPS